MSPFNANHCDIYRDIFDKWMTNVPVAKLNKQRILYPVLRNTEVITLKETHGSNTS